VDLVAVRDVSQPTGESCQIHQRGQQATGVQWLLLRIPTRQWDKAEGGAMKDLDDTTGTLTPAMTDYNAGNGWNLVVSTKAIP
jgi:hypothetical protein